VSVGFEALGIRARACAGFRWMLGAADLDGYRCAVVDKTGPLFSGGPKVALAAARVPDLRDPATQGCVLALIAERNLRRSIFDALNDVAHRMRSGLSYEEALVVTLEEAPSRVETCEAQRRGGS